MRPHLKNLSADDLKTCRTWQLCTYGLVSLIVFAFIGWKLLIPAPTTEVAQTKQLVRVGEK
jgi:hypothetical protein